MNWVNIDEVAVAPQVTWGTLPEIVGGGVDSTVPLLDDFAHPDRQASVARALDYMALAPGQRLTDIRLDKVLIGSYTNGRIEDLALLQQSRNSSGDASHPASRSRW